jgi:hypothetical protein
VAPQIKSENTKKLERLIHVRQDEAKWFAVLRVSNLRTRSDIIILQAPKLRLLKI